jgi:hypothetical protein
MNFDSFALSKFDPAKAAIFGRFPGPAGISIVSMAIFAARVCFGIVAIELAHRGVAERARRPAVVNRMDDA